MNLSRRRFFGFTLAGMAGACLAPFLPKPNPAPGLVFHKDAFACAMEPLQHDEHGYFVDVRDGWAYVHPELACRIREP